MKIGDRHTFTIGRDDPERAARLAALAAFSLTMVMRDRPMPSEELDAVVGDMGTMTGRLAVLAECLQNAAVEPQAREELDEARRVLDLASNALFRAGNPGNPESCA